MTHAARQVSPRLLLALASAGAVAGISAFQSARKLSQADVDRYTGQLVIPDARWIAGAASLANLLLAGWIRTALRTRSTRKARIGRPRR